MDDCTYNKIRILKDLALVKAFIERHAKDDAKSAKHKACEEMLANLHKDLTKYMDQLKTSLSNSKL